MTHTSSFLTARSSRKTAPWSLRPSSCSRAERECYPFLKMCRDNNCIVHFKNENLTISPDRQDDSVSLKLLIYLAIAGSHEFGDDFIRYLNNMEKMSWEAVSVQ